MAECRLCLTARLARGRAGRSWRSRWLAGCRRGARGL